MLITDDFVMINFPKTASTFTREVLKEVYSNKGFVELFLPGITNKRDGEVLNQHGVLRQIPFEHKEKPILSVIRNPFKRYESLYYYRWWEKHPPADISTILKRYPHFPEISFEEYYEMIHIYGIKNMLGDIIPKIELGLHTTQFVQFYYNNPEQIYKEINNSYIENKLFFNDLKKINFLHQENLVNELKAFLVKKGFSQEELSFIDTKEKVNVSKRENNNDLIVEGSEIYEKIINREKLIFAIFPEYLPKTEIPKYSNETLKIMPTTKSLKPQKKNRTYITLSMIVKNEEKYLRGCLESVKDVVDEIVIVDTGSTDNTLKIAEEFGAKIYHFEWIKDFSAARNFALSKSTGNWILYLDADERIEQKSKKEIFRLTKNNKKLGINCIINNLDDNKKAPTLMKYVRLFRNNKNISFVGKAHEQIESSLRQQGYKIIDSNIEITHLGYNVSKDKLKEKANRNLELLLNEYNEKPTWYGAYQIANSYSVLDDMENSILFTKRTLEYKNLRKEFKSVCYIRIANFEMEKGNLDYAKKMIDKGIQSDRNHPLMNYLAAHIYQRFGLNDEALEFCKNT